MTALKRALKKLLFVPLLQRRRQRASLAAAAGRVFQNPRVLLAALEHKAADPVVLHTRDGLRLTIRQNLWDARIVQEIFLEEPYTRGLTLPPAPSSLTSAAISGIFPFSPRSVWAPGGSSSTSRRRRISPC